MGCCFSSNNKNPHQPDAVKPPLPLSESDKARVDSRAPPPVLEEETVKEVVLSETPLPNLQSPKRNTTQMPVIEEDLVDYANKHEEEVSQVSQVSEIYSESFSTTTTATTTTTTTAVTDKREDEAISKLTTREASHAHRSPAKVPRKRPYTGEASRGAKSPAKRSSEMSHVGPRRTMPRNVGPNGFKRETGDGPSDRRSRSPATRTVSGVGRSPGKVRTAGRPGGRLRVENTGQKKVDQHDDVLQKQQNSECNESLDNPHVSLECFIFL